MTGVMIIVAVLGAVAAVAALVAVTRVPRGPAEEVRGLIEGHGLRLDRLSDAVGRQALDDQAVRDGLERTRAALEEMRLQTEERRRSEEASWEVVRRMESVLSGGSTRGRAGENVLEEALACLPAGMLV